VRPGIAASFADTVPLPPPEAEPKRKRIKPAKNAPRFVLRSELKRITGVDLTRIDGIDVTFCVNVATRALHAVADRFLVNIKPSAWWSLLWCV
jgi:hypothetical protein